MGTGEEVVTSHHGASSASCNRTHRHVCLLWSQSLRISSGYCILCTIVFYYTTFNSSRFAPVQWDSNTTFVKPSRARSHQRLMHRAHFTPSEQRFKHFKVLWQVKDVSHKTSRHCSTLYNHTSCHISVWFLSSADGADMKHHHHLCFGVSNSWFGAFHSLHVL